MFPIPAHDQLTILLHENANAVELRSMEGKVVYHSTVSSSNTIRLSLPQLSQGLYLLEVQTTHNRILRKVVIE